MELWIATDTQYAGTGIFLYIKVIVVYTYNRLEPEESLDVLMNLWSIDSLIAYEICDEHLLLHALRGERFVYSSQPRMICH